MTSIICQNCEVETIEVEICMTMDNLPICAICWNSELESGHTIKIFETSGIYEFVFSSLIGGFYNKKTAQLSRTIPGIDSMSDGIVIINPKFTNIVSGWIFEFGDENYLKFVGFMKQLTTRAVVPPVPTIITLTQLGDLKMGVNIITRDIDRYVFTNWLTTSNLLP